MRPGFPNAVLAATTEVVAGLGLAAGLFTPLSAAAGVIALMLVAIVVAHRKNGFFIFYPGQGWEYCPVVAAGGLLDRHDRSRRLVLDHALDLDVEGWWGAGIALVVGVAAAALQLAACYRPPKPALTPSDQ